jgi:hypothetical protein
MTLERSREKAFYLEPKAANLPLVYAHGQQGLASAREAMILNGFLALFASVFRGSASGYFLVTMYGS